ncbi:hypothetical protein ACS0TY_029709 [Phlomoides rotata]
MLCLQIVLAITLLSLIFIFQFSKNTPLAKLLPTAYFRSHELYDKLTQVLAEKSSWFTGNDIIVTTDPANVHHVLSSKFSIYSRGSEFRKAFDFLGDAVFVKDLDEWKEGKKFTHAFYKEEEFHKSTPLIIDRTLEKGLVPVLDDVADRNEVIDLQDLFSRYMLDATCLLATGFDLASLRVGLPVCPLLDAMDDMAAAVFWRNVLPESVWKLQKWVGVGKEKKMAEACLVLNRTLEDFVTNKEEVAGKDQEGFDVLKFYMGDDYGYGSRKKTENNKAFLCANIMTLFFAGRDTSSALLTWFFYLISRNPRVQKKILEEIEQNLSPPPKRHRFAKAEELSKLVYLQSALTESLRLFPTAPVIIRNATQEDVLPSGHRVGKSAKVILCSYAMGRRPEIWGEDCGEFKPERWAGEKGGVKHVGSNSFLAFGSGPWACPGRELAFARMKGVVATILHNYDVGVLEGQSVGPSVSALLNVNNGLKARVSKKWM